MRTPDKGFDLHATVTNRIIQLMEQGTIPWRKPWSSAGPPMNAITKRPYNGINLWLLLSLCYDSNLFLTWEQVQQVGGWVMRGEKGHMVVYWSVLSIVPPTSEETDKEKWQRPLLRYYTVFNTDQCSGIPDSILESDYERQLNPIAACENIVAGMSNPPEIRFEKAKAFYSPTEDYINLPKMQRFISEESYYSTLFHELVHSTGHSTRLNRKTVTNVAQFGSESYSIEELVAELGTCYLCSYSGILQEQINNSAAYIQGWLSQLRNDKRFIVHGSSLAQKAVNYILGPYSTELDMPLNAS